MSKIEQEAFNNPSENPSGERLADQLQAQKLLDRERESKPASDVIIDHMLHAAKAIKEGRAVRGQDINLNDIMHFYDAENAKPYIPQSMSESVRSIQSRGSDLARAWREQDALRGVTGDKRFTEAWEKVRLLIDRAEAARNEGKVRSESVDAFAELLKNGFTEGHEGDHREQAYYELYVLTPEDDESRYKDREVFWRFIHDDKRELWNTVKGRKRGRRTEDQGDQFVYFYGDEPGDTITERLYIGVTWNNEPQNAMANWGQAVDQAGLDGKLHYKMACNVYGRSDSIVIYVTPGVREQLPQLIADFLEKTPVASLREQATPTGNDVARGVSYGVEYQNLDMIAQLLQSEYIGTSYGSIISAFSRSAFEMAYKRCYERNIVTRQQIKTDDLAAEAKTYMRELLELAGINPETMIPFEQNGGQLPDWVRQTHALAPNI